MISEFEEAKLLSEKILNEPNADPDSNECLLARQFNRLVERAETAKSKTMKTADNWYSEEEVFQFINRKPSFWDDERRNVPEDIHSREFAKWMANEYRLAMAKGIQMANSAIFG